MELLELSELGVLGGAPPPELEPELDTELAGGKMLPKPRTLAGGPGGPDKALASLRPGCMTSARITAESVNAARASPTRASGADRNKSSSRVRELAS